MNFMRFKTEWMFTGGPERPDRHIQMPTTHGTHVYRHVQAPTCVKHMHACAKKHSHKKEEKQTTTMMNRPWSYYRTPLTLNIQIFD